MKRYKHSLQSPLAIKEKTLEKENIKLATMNKTLQAQKGLLEKAVEAFLMFNDEFTKSELNFNTLNIIKQVSYVDRLTKNIDNQKKAVTETEKNVLLQRRRVKDVYKELKNLKVLEERKKAQFKKEFIKIENKILDDITNLRIKPYKRA